MLRFDLKVSYHFNVTACWLCAMPREGRDPDRSKGAKLGMPGMMMQMQPHMMDAHDVTWQHDGASDESHGHSAAPAHDGSS